MKPLRICLMNLNSSYPFKTINKQSQKAVRHTQHAGCLTGTMTCYHVLVTDNGIKACLCFNANSVCSKGSVVLALSQYKVGEVHCFTKGI